jgi:glycosyltransferase involved in cell wall biosynthesis
LLVEPGRPEAIADAVEGLLTDDQLRSTLVSEGRKWATPFTNERSCALIVDRLRALVQERAS